MDLGGVTPAHLILWGALPADSLSTDSAVWRTRCTWVVGDRDEFVTEPMISAARLGRRLEIVNMDFGALIPALISGSSQ